MIPVKTSRQTAKDNIKSIVSQSSIHALPNIVNSEYVAMKLIWLVFFILAIGYCANLLVQMVQNYLKYDVLININYLNDYSVDFPAVTICDFIPINRSLDEMVLSCYFNNEPCNRSYFSKVLSLKYGQCNAFNVYREGQSVLRSPRAGVDFGLTLELFVGTPSQFPAFIPVTGLIVTIYNSSSRPSFAEEAIRIGPGLETSLMISRQIMYKLPKPFSDCIQNASDPFAFDSDEYRGTFDLSRAYRQKICLSVCTKTNPSNLEGRNISDCLQKCPQECDLIEFKVFSHFSFYPNDQYALELRKKSSFLTNLSISDIQESVALLNINYESLVTTVIEETPAMPFLSLLGNVGGQLGLFLGMSFLSFLELLEMIFVLVWEFCVAKIDKFRTPNASPTPFDKY